MVPIARRNLFAEKGRFAISVAGVGFAVVLILIVLSLYRGWSGIGGIIEELPADLWVLQEGTTDPFHSVSLLDEDLAGEIGAIDGVLSVTAVYSRTMSAEVNGAETPLRLMALDPPAGAEPSPLLPRAGSIAIDEAFSSKHGIGVGDSVVIGRQTLTVSDVFSGGNAVMFQFAFVSAADARELFGFPGAVNYFLLTLASGVADDTASDRIASSVSGVTVQTGAEFTAGLRREINEGFLPVVGVLVLIGFVVGAAIIGLTTYTATIEKSRDFGVMKAVGGSGGFLYRIVISQSLILSIAGFAAGLVVTVLASIFAQDLVPEFVTDLRWYDAAGTFVATLAMAVLASYIPVTRVNSIDPAMVFRA